MAQKQHPRLRPAPIPVFPSSPDSLTNNVYRMHEDTQGGKAASEFRRTQANVEGGSRIHTRHFAIARAPEHSCKTDS